MYNFIIQVSSPMEFTKVRSLIKLTTYSLTFGSVVDIAGFGQVISTITPTSTRYLQKITMRVQSQSQCQKYFPFLNYYQGCVDMISPFSGISKVR